MEQPLIDYCGPCYHVNGDLEPINSYGYCPTCKQAFTVTRYIYAPPTEAEIIERRKEHS